MAVTWEPCPCPPDLLGLWADCAWSVCWVVHLPGEPGSLGPFATWESAHGSELRVWSFRPDLVGPWSGIRAWNSAWMAGIVDGFRQSDPPSPEEASRRAAPGYLESVWLGSTLP